MAVLFRDFRYPRCELGGGLGNREERSGPNKFNKKPLPMISASKGGSTVCLLSKQIDKE